MDPSHCRHHHHLAVVRCSAVPRSLSMLAHPRGAASQSLSWRPLGRVLWRYARAAAPTRLSFVHVWPLCACIAFRTVQRWPEDAVDAEAKAGLRCHPEGRPNHAQGETPCCVGCVVSSRHHLTVVCPPGVDRVQATWRDGCGVGVGHGIPAGGSRPTRERLPRRCARCHRDTRQAPATCQHMAWHTQPRRRLRASVTARAAVGSRGWPRWRYRAAEGAAQAHSEAPWQC